MQRRYYGRHHETLTLIQAPLLKSLLNKIPRLYLYVLTVLCLFLIIQSALRLIFWLKFHNPADPVSTADLLWSFYLGMKFDLQATLGMLLPVLLLGWIPPLHPVYSRFGRRFWAVLISIAIFLMYVIYITDAGHYAYLQQRLNATALRFLENPWISATMVWETYPVIWGGLILLAVTAVTIYIFLKLTALIRPEEGKPWWRRQRWYFQIVFAFLSLFIVLAGFMAKISWYPLRWSDAFFSTHAFSAQLASNPVIYFINTMKNIEESYDPEATRRVYPIMVDYLGIKQPDVETLNYRREYSFPQDEQKRPNVIVVILESFASYKTTLSGNPIDPTPNMAKIAREGYYFRNFFTPSTGTARSVWTFTTGLPDIEKNKTSTRNPLIVDQHTIINDFKGYEKYYFLGGSASWANIRGLLASNIPGLKIYEEGSYESPRIDVWGISDLSLFHEANAVLAREKKPFFAVIQTSGNHRPYTIPEDNEDFVMLTEADLPEPVQNYGFQSLEELNSFRFMDHSLGHFMKMAAKEPYFDNTLFVFFGDHGIHAPTGSHILAWEEQLRVQGLRVPLVMFGKSVISKPEVFDTIASEVDVLPTIASLTRTPYLDTTLGRDLFDESFSDERYAFTIEHGSGRTIGLLSDKFYLLRQVDGEGEQLHQLDGKNPRKDVSAKFGDVKKDMEEKLEAIWQTIRYMRENNRPDETEQPGATTPLQ